MPVGPHRRIRSLSACSAGAKGLALSSGPTATPAISKQNRLTETSTRHHRPEKRVEIRELGSHDSRAPSEIRFPAAQTGTSSHSHCRRGLGSGSRALREPRGLCLREALATGRETEDENSAATVRKKTTAARESPSISSSKSMATCHGDRLSQRQTCCTTRDLRTKTTIGNNCAAALKSTRYGASSHMEQLLQLSQCSAVALSHAKGASSTVCRRPAPSRRTSVETSVTHRSLLSTIHPPRDYPNPPASPSSSSERCERPTSNPLKQQSQQGRCLFAEAAISVSPHVERPPLLAPAACAAAASALLPSAARNADTCRLTMEERRCPRRCCGSLSSQTAAAGSPFPLSKPELVQQRGTAHGAGFPLNAVAAAEKTTCALTQTQEPPPSSSDGGSAFLGPAATTAALPHAASSSDAACPDSTPLRGANAAPNHASLLSPAPAMTAAAPIAAAVCSAATSGAVTSAAAAAAVSAGAVSFAAVRHARLSNGSSCLTHLRWWLRQRLRLASSGLFHCNIRNTSHVAAAALLAPTHSAAAAANLADNSTAAGRGALADASAALSCRVSTAVAVSISHQPERKRRLSSGGAASAAPPDAGDFSSTAATTDTSAAAFSNYTVEAVAAQLSHKLICCLLLKEKSSVLLLGPPGSGKTAAVELALRTVQQLAQQQRIQRMQQQQQQEQQQQMLHFKSESATPGRYDPTRQGEAPLPAAVTTEVQHVLVERHRLASPAAAGGKSVIEASPASPLRCSRPLRSAAAAGALEPPGAASKTILKGRKDRYTAAAGDGRSPLIKRGAVAGLSANNCEPQQQQLPDLLVVRICCSLYPDETAMLHTIVLQLAQALHCQQQPAATASFEELSDMLRRILGDSCSVFSRAVVIVLDHFEVCCVSPEAAGAAAAGRRGGGWGFAVGGLALQHGRSSSSKRQQLLYCLFDLQHSSKLQLCTVCVSSILDITEYMEKRIRSRFSLQTLYVAGCPTAAQLLRFTEQHLLSLSPQQLLQVATDAAAAEQIFTTWLDPAAAPDTLEGAQQHQRGERENEEEDTAARGCLPGRKKERQEDEMRQGDDNCAGGEETEGVGDAHPQRFAKETETRDQQTVERLQGEALREQKGKPCVSCAEVAEKTGRHHALVSLSGEAATEGKSLQVVGRALTPKRRHVETAAEEDYCRLASVAQTHTPQKTATDVNNESAAEGETEAGGDAATAKDVETGAVFWEKRDVAENATQRKKMKPFSAGGEEAKETTRHAIAVSSVRRGSHERVSGKEGLSTLYRYSNSRFPRRAADARLGSCTGVIGKCERSRRWKPTAQDRLVADVFVAAYLAAVSEEFSSPLFRMRFTRYVDLGRQPRFFFTLLVDHLLSEDLSQVPPSPAAAVAPAKSLVRSPCLPASSAATEGIDDGAAAWPAGGSAAAATTVEPSTCSAAAAGTHNCTLGFPLSGDVKGPYGAPVASAAVAALSPLLRSSSSISPLRPAAAAAQRAFLEEPQQQQHMADGEDGPTKGHQDIDKETKTPTRGQQQPISAADSSFSPAGNGSPFSAASKDSFFVEMSPTPPGGGNAAAARESKRRSAAAAAAETAAQTEKTHHLFGKGSVLQEETGVSSNHTRTATRASYSRTKNQERAASAAAAAGTIHARVSAVEQHKQEIEGVLEDLSLPEHFLLGAFTRLHEQRRFPKTLHLACEQLSHLFVHRHARQQQPNIAGLRRAFMRLLETGVLRLCDVAAIQQTGAFSAVTAATADGVFSSCYLYYVPCKFPAYAKYREMLEVLRLPGEFKAWVRSFDFSS